MRARRMSGSTAARALTLAAKLLAPLLLLLAVMLVLLGPVGASVTDPSGNAADVLVDTATTTTTLPPETSTTTETPTTTQTTEVPPTT
jgi:hypothetical protein